MRSDLDWIRLQLNNDEAAARLKKAGHTVDGWMNGRPVLRKPPKDWEEIERIALGESSHDDLTGTPTVNTMSETTQEQAPPSQKRKPRRKKGASS